MNRNFNCCIRSCFILSALYLILPAAHIKSQGFGRNKVLYEKFDFHLRSTAHFSIHHYLDSSSVKNISYLCERWYNRYEKLFQDTFLHPLPVIIYADHPDFQQTEVISGLIDPGTGGVTEGLKNRLIMPLAGSYYGSEHVLGHEMAHMFQYHLLRGSDSLRMESIYNVPLWMIEGMAEYLSLGPENTLTAMWMRDAVLHNDIPSIKKISYDFHYNPYRYGHALWSFIAGYWGDDIIPKLFLNTAKLGLEPAIKLTLGITNDSLSDLWIKTIKETCQPQIVSRTKPYAVGKSILSAYKQGAELYLAPSISPDGSKVVFFSEKDLFTVDIFLADTQDGKIIRKLGKKEGNAHYDELNFLASSGSWSPDSKKFAFSVYSEGNQKIVISDIKTGKIKKTIGFPFIGSIFNIAWSPDAQYLVFSATGNNSLMADLYLYDLHTETLQQLTTDLYADLHPAWSADGKQIAFISDRGTATDFSKLEFGKMQVCFYDVLNKKIEVLNLFKGAQHLNPQFSMDGASVFFISDPDGINNIYRYDRNTQQVYKITNVITGVSGLADLSPALTVSKATGEMIFTLYDDSQFKGYSLTNEQTKGKLDTTSLFPKLNLLPPDKRKSSFVSDYMNSASATDVAKKAIRYEQEYKPRLDLDYIGGLYVGAGFNQYGAALQGGVFLQFTDMLNHHVLNTAIQINGKITDIAAMGLYLNQNRRFHWGAYASHIPYLSSSVYSRSDTVPGNGSSAIVPVIDQIILRSYEERFALLGSYPLSMTKRLDFQAGETFVSYTKERTTYYPVDAPVENREATKKLPAPASLRYTNIAVAYTGDNSFFGITDPLRGSRYRFEAEGIINSFTLMNFLADYRRYIYVKPFSIAFRLMHYGRYFQDADNANIPPLFLGNEYYIRGYSIFSFNANECNGDDKGSCPTFDRLLGNKIAVMNLELRLPFTGPGRLAVIKSNVFYSSLNLFLDGGTAWWKNDKPVIALTATSEKRIPVFSTGISYRINFFGVMVFEFYYAYPFQRPQRNWHVGFQIMPGW